MWMNEMDIDTALARYRQHPLLGPAVKTLDSLRTAVNGCSDGWPYWRAPAKAADRLMTLIQEQERWDRTEYQRPRQGAEATAKALREAYAQLRRFRTLRAAVGGLDFTIYAAPDVPGDPVPEPTPAPVQHQIRITVTGDRATVTVAGDGPLPTGRYMGAVVKLTDHRGEQVAS